MSPKVPSAKLLFLFAPGAGAPSTHSWMTHWAKLLGELGKVITLDYPYRLAGKNVPDRMPVLIEAHREALRRVKRQYRRPVVLIGKSMGSRVGCHLALEEKVQAVVCLGYPLCAAGDRSKLRDQVLLDLQTPILFVQGTRDPLCPLDLLRRVRRKMSVLTNLVIIKDGDHSLQVTQRQLKASKETQSEVDARILEEIRKFTGC